MDEYFVIPVNYAWKELEFEARLLLQGYVHKIEIIVDEIPVLLSRMKKEITGHWSVPNNWREKENT